MIDGNPCFWQREGGKGEKLALPDYHATVPGVSQLGSATCKRCLVIVVSLYLMKQHGGTVPHSENGK